MDLDGDDEDSSDMDEAEPIERYRFKTVAYFEIKVIVGGLYD